MVVSVQIAPPDFDPVFAALADHTRRDIVRRAISAEEGVLELASHYPMSFAAVQKHVAVLERAGLITTRRYLENGMRVEAAQYTQHSSRSEELGGQMTYRTGTHATRCTSTHT